MAKGPQTRDRILDTAFRLAARDGLEGLSLSALAAEIGLSKSGLFAHFTSKEELQLEMLRVASERFMEEVMAPAFKQPRGLPRLRALFEGWRRWATATVPFAPSWFLSSGSCSRPSPGPRASASRRVISAATSTSTSSRSTFSPSISPSTTRTGCCAIPAPSSGCAARIRAWWRTPPLASDQEERDDASQPRTNPEKHDRSFDIPWSTPPGRGRPRSGPAPRLRAVRNAPAPPRETVHPRPPLFGDRRRPRAGRLGLGRRAHGAARPRLERQRGPALRLRRAAAARRLLRGRARPARARRLGRYAHARDRHGRCAAPSRPPGGTGARGHRPFAGRGGHRHRARRGARRGTGRADRAAHRSPAVRPRVRANGRPLATLSGGHGVPHRQDPGRTRRDRSPASRGRAARSDAGRARPGGPRGALRRRPRSRECMAWSEPPAAVRGRSYARPPASGGDLAGGRVRGGPGAAAGPQRVSGPTFAF